MNSFSFTFFVLSGEIRAEKLEVERHDLVVLGCMVHGFADKRRNRISPSVKETHFSCCKVGGMCN